MKTIKQIADLCGMSKTSINRAIEELKIEKTLVGNKNLVSDTDADRIVSLLCGFGKTCAEINPNQSKTETETEQNKTNPSNSTDSVFSVSEKNNEQLVNFLLEQIKTKDRQIESLQEENKMLIQSNAYTLKQLEDIKRIQADDIEPDIQVVNQPQSAEPEPPEPREKEKRFLFWKIKSK